MSKLNYSLICAVLFATVTNGISYGHDIERLCPDAKVYENHNQVDYGPLKLPSIQGRGVVGHSSEFAGHPVGGACLSLFSETTHKWIKTIVADSEGRFKFDLVNPGRYRLIARAPYLCPANIPIVVTNSGRRNRLGSLQLLIHFKAMGLVDECSFGQIVDE